MCSIAGILGLPSDPHIQNAMLQTMQRRGPDGQGIYREGTCTLLHTRLAIIDPAGGAQPMALQWGNTNYVITYNGELYNTQELRSELRACGHSFLSHSDTEVLLHAYAQWGAACLDRLNGIYAFAVWEKETGQLFLARDPMGVKPLFYTIHNGGLIFGSEIKTLLAYPTVEARLDADGAAQLLLLGPGRKPGSGVLQNIYELEPGFWGLWDGNRLHTHRYWSLVHRDHKETFEETVEQVRYLVRDSIRRQMVSDVPIGTFLSGGLDSSLISSVCACEMAGMGEQLDTFSVDYENNEAFFQPNKFQPASDGDYIRKMQHYLDSRHHWSILTPEDLVDALESATIARDLPGMADVDFSLLAFCGQIRTHVKVALSGECADEIFGGYPWYRDPEVRAVQGFPWAQNTAYRASYLHPRYLTQLEPEDYVQSCYLQTLSQTDTLPGTSAQERRMKEMTNLNYRWFIQTLLDRKDRMSMYHGLEVRVPFCDRRIAEYLYSVPWEYKDRNGQEKGLLRNAAIGLLPDDVLWRKKSPYPKTWDPKYLQLVQQRLQGILDDPGRSLFGIVSYDAVQQLLSAEHTWPWYGQLMRRPQLMAYILQLDFWLQHYNVRIL